MALFIFILSIFIAYLLRYMHNGIQVTFNTAAIEPTPVECNCFNCIIGSLFVDGISELDLTTSACLLIAKDIKDVRRQYISSNAGKFRGRFICIGLFYKSCHRSWFIIWNHNPILRNIRAVDFHYAQLSFARLCKCPSEIGYYSTTLIDKKVICKQYSKGIISYYPLRAEHSVA